MSEGQGPASPGEYLAAGWRTADGAVLPDLVGQYAMATAQRFRAAEVSPQLLATLRTALDQVLPDVGGAGEERMAAALDAALGVTEELLGTDVGEAVEDWIIACAEHVRSDDDLAAFLTHFDAVVRIYGALVAIELANATPGPV